MVFIFILSVITLAIVAYTAWQVYLLREQVDDIETKLLRLRLVKNKAIKHANEEE